VYILRHLLTKNHVAKKTRFQKKRVSCKIGIDNVADNSEENDSVGHFGYLHGKLIQFDDAEVTRSAD